MARPEFFQRFEKEEISPFLLIFLNFGPISLAQVPFITHLLFLSLLLSVICNSFPFGIVSFTHSYLFLAVQLHPFTCCISSFSDYLWYQPLYSSSFPQLFSHLIISRMDLRHESYTLLLTVICNPLSLRIVSFIRSSPTLTFSLLPFHSPASHRLRLSYS